METTINDITIKYDEKSFDFTYTDGTRVKYPVVNIIGVKIDNIFLDSLFKLFNESNYNVVEQLYIAPEFEIFSNKVFDVIYELIVQKKYILSRGLADYYFGMFTILWQYFLKHQRHMLGTTLWQHVCRIVWNWERKNNKKIHKGTPYFFLGGNLLFQGNVDIAFLLIYNAIEEDKRFSREYGGDQELYKNLPAYLFSSIVDNPHNFLYSFVQLLRNDIKTHIISYNKEYKKNFSFADFDKKFLKNDILEKEKYFFVYSMNNIKNSKNIIIKELENNEFSKLKNLDTVFNLCLIIDNILGKKINEKYISGKIKKLCSQKYNVSEQDCENIKKKLDFENNPENAIMSCLSLNYIYNGIPVKKEVLNLIFIWGLRNYGGHKIESGNILIEKFEEILKLIFNGLFIILQEIY